MSYYDYVYKMCIPQLHFIIPEIIPYNVRDDKIFVKKALIWLKDSLGYFDIDISDRDYVRRHVQFLIDSYKRFK